MSLSQHYKLPQMEEKMKQDGYQWKKQPDFPVDSFKITGNKSLVLLSVFIFFFGLLSSGQKVFDDRTKEPEIGIVEHLDTFLPKDIYLINEKNERVLLTDLIDKPTIINFVYFRCPGICSPLMEGLAKVMDQSDLIAGIDYQVLTISFDPRETIDLGIRKKSNYLNLVNKKEPISKGWKFFVSDSASIAKGTNAVGFKYKKAGNDFTHAASITVVSPKGKITRYLNGINYLPFDFKMAISEAQKGIAQPSINRVLRFCFSYDPQGKRYALQVTKIVGILTLFIILMMVLILFIRKRNRK